MLIEGQLAEGTISKADLIALASGGNESTRMLSPEHAMPMQSVSAPAPAAPESSRNLINALYAIGAIIALVGVGILVAQHWVDIGFAGRVLVSLGISLVTFMSGMFFMKPHQRVVAQVLFTISAALAPLGAYVVLHEAGMNLTAGVQMFIALALALVFGVALFVRRLNILAFLLIAFLTWAYYALIADMFPNFSFSDFDVYKWATLILGATYLLVGYGYPNLSPGGTDPAVEKERRGIRSILYGFGTLGVLGVISSFGGAFDFIAIAVIFGLFYGSVFVKSRAMLVLSALFLIYHIVSITSKYFVGSLGWPVSLIIIGFMIIGIGYFTVYLNKRYFSTR